MHIYIQSWSKGNRVREKLDKEEKKWEGSQREGEQRKRKNKQEKVRGQN